MKKEIRVAVGVVYRHINTEIEILIAKRQQHQHQGGLWEFPGGKIEGGECCLDALKREFLEEVNITIISAEELINIVYDYGDKVVVLETMLTNDYEGLECGVEGQEVKWVSMSELKNLSFPEANKAIIEAINKELVN